MKIKTFMIEVRERISGSGYAGQVLIDAPNILAATKAAAGACRRRRGPFSGLYRPYITQVTALDYPKL